MTPEAAGVDPLLTVGDVLAMTGYRSRTTLWRKVRAGGFPPPRKDGPTSVRWRASDIQRWIDGLPVHTYGD
jgi:prophage regulatory protein